MDLYIAKDGTESGPYSADQVESLHRAGMLRSDDLVWHEGMSEWSPLHRYLGLRPPVPPAPPARNGVASDHGEGVSGNGKASGISSERRGVKRRAVWEIYVPIFLTLGLYCLYLLPRQSWEISRVTREKRLNPWFLGFLILITLGLFGIVYQIYLGWKFQALSQELKIPGRNSSLGTTVMTFSIGSVAAMYSSMEFAIIVSAVLGMIPFWLVQKEINAYLGDNPRD